MSFSPKFLILFLAFGLLSASAFAQGAKYTHEDIQRKVEEAASLLQKQTPESAFDLFQKKGGPFNRDGFYIFVFNQDGLFMVHGERPSLVGKGGSDMKDGTGRYFVRSILDVQKEGWVRYEWPDSQDGNKLKRKNTFVKRVGEYLVCGGYFKE